MGLPILRQRVQGWTSSRRGVVDLGCGDGHWSIECRAEKYVGVDTEPQEPAAEGTKIVLADVHEIAKWAPAATGCDTALLMDLIEHLPKTAGERFLETLHRHFSR